MKSLIIIFFSLLFHAAVAVSGTFSELEARKVAQSFLKRHSALKVRSRFPEQENIGLTALNGTPYNLYGFNVDHGGFVLVSTNGVVIGYSDNPISSWQDAPEPFRELAVALSLQSSVVSISSSRETSSNRRANRSAVEPLITTTWHQTAPYNSLCPEGCVTGCVATAMAQVMMYHRWPQTGCTEIPAYGNYGSLPQIVFGWQQMKDVYTVVDDADDCTAVAQLMMYCGRAVQTIYSKSSLAHEFRIPLALSRYFGYDSSIRRVVRSDYNIDEWDSLIYDELAEGRPVIYSGQRTQGTVHEFIVDGFDGNGYYHINWGWGGTGDGYFLLCAPVPGETSAGGGSGYDGYTMDQSAVIGIKPEANGDAPVYEKTLTVEDFGLMSGTTEYHRNSIDEPFTVEIRNVQGNHGNKTIGCYPGIGLYQSGKEIGVMSGAFSTYDPGSFSGKHWDGIYRYVPYKLTFGEGMTGSYRLIPVCGQGGLVMVTWKPSEGADMHYVDVEMTENTLTLTEHPIRELSILSAAIEGDKGGVLIGKAIVKNDGDEFNGKLYLQINGKLATGTGTAIANGEIAEVTFHFMSDEEINDFRIGFWPDGESWLCEGTGREWKIPTCINSYKAKEIPNELYRLDGSKGTRHYKGIYLYKGHKILR